MSQDTSALTPQPGASPEAVWRVAGWVVAQGALLASLLLYFGWARTQRTFAYFGVDLSLLDFANTDYILRSVGSAYMPMLRLGLVAVAGFALHRYLASRPAAAARAHNAVGVLAIALLVLGGSALLMPAWSARIGHWMPNSPAIFYAWLPASLATAFALLIYAGTATGRFKQSELPRALLVALLVMALFWTVSLFAVYDGLARAKAIERELPNAAEVVVLSQSTLFLHGHGVSDSDLVPAGTGKPVPGRYRKQYSGLRLLMHSGGKYFLLPSHWRRGRDRVAEIPDDEQIRIEIVTPPV
ncbi:hypothetical protein OM076_02365 [Solirubrobacter ginsenosidimutans]|uniref:Uncharacterized protein n=1 Tax=Solirubrobacter ginsenosidimutans TaxID=490573 RepID=A0A9X3MM40_9ACTN|nr:hypothetical protein [Solirubrobacter ginsenosidimutans]MDA0159096.1 hypothetical protein [Solirubrobacter ginsenosidimutans]